MAKYQVRKVTKPRKKRKSNHITKDETDDETFQYSKEKDDGPPEDYNLTLFEEDNYREHQKRCLSNIGQVNCSTTRSIDLIGYKQAL